MIFWSGKLEINNWNVRKNTRKGCERQWQICEERNVIADQIEKSVSHGNLIRTLKEEHLVVEAEALCPNATAEDIIELDSSEQLEEVVSK